MKFRFLSLPALLLCFLLFLSACTQKNPPAQVVVWELSDPEMLQPLNTTEYNADKIMHTMFQALLEIDTKTLELTPVLAESRPKIEKTPKGGMNLTFRIRDEAKWDNGSPVTAQDVVFTLKATFNPKMNDFANRQTMDFISDIQIYPDDPKKLTIQCDTVYYLLEAGCGGFQILPEYFYDPKGLMKKYTVRQLMKEGDKVANDPGILEFANDLNSEMRMRDKNFISGSGPYKLDEWVTHKRVVVKKKDHFWGDALADQVPYLRAYPKRIVYSTINDFTSAVEALKAGDLDVLNAIKPKSFMELQKNASFMQKFNLYTPNSLNYYFIGMNTKSKLLRGKKTRQAISCLTDVDKIIKTVYYGFATRIIGSVPIFDTKDYNKEVPFYPYDIAKARKLLEEDGWKDSNGDGILDKVIDGERTEFKITFTFNSGNELRKSIALIFQEDARKAGIETTLVQQEFNTYFGNLKNHQVELFISAWAGAPVGTDLKQIWHSEAAVAGGNNFANFTNPACDSILDAVRVELNDDKRAILLKKIQVLIHDEAPFVFLFAPTEMLAISKKFTNAEPSVMRPGYNPMQFMSASKN